MGPGRRAGRLKYPLHLRVEAEAVVARNHRVGSLAVSHFPGEIWKCFVTSQIRFVSKYLQPAPRAFSLLAKPAPVKSTEVIQGLVPIYLAKCSSSFCSVLFGSGDAGQNVEITNSCSHNHFQLAALSRSFRRAFCKGRDYGPDLGSKSSMPPGPRYWT